MKVTGDVAVSSSEKDVGRSLAATRSP